jgi:uncharacterized membrane protein
VIALLAGLGNRALFYALGALAVIGALAALFFNIRASGRAAERVDVMRNTLEVKRAQQKAAAAAPADRAALVDELRRGRF